MSDTTDKETRAAVKLNELVALLGFFSLFFIVLLLLFLFVFCCLMPLLYTRALPVPRPPFVVPASLPPPTPNPLLFTQTTYV